MNTESQLYFKTLKVISESSGLSFSSGSELFTDWLKQRKIHRDIIYLFSKCIPQDEAWAGAGALFGESKIMKWNNDFPEALENDLLITGSAPNGDIICIDLKTGGVGYICHEKDWPSNPRDSYASVSKSIGSFLHEINSNPPLIPEDYWEAIK